MNYMTSATEIGQRMRSCRKSIGLTQAEIAEKMDLSINYVSDLENGKKNMSILTMASLCKCFDKSADYFLYGTEDKRSRHRYGKSNRIRLDTFQSAVRSFTDLCKFIDPIEK